MMAMVAIVVVIVVLAGGVLLVGIGYEQEVIYSPEVGDYIEWNAQYEPTSTIPPLFNHTLRYTILEVTETNLVVDESIRNPEHLTLEMIALNQNPLRHVGNSSFPIAGFSWLNAKFKNSTWAGFSVRSVGMQLISTECGQLSSLHYVLTAENPSGVGRIVMFEFWTYHAILIKMTSSYNTNNYLLIDTNIGIIVDSRSLLT